jgi:hypothetical protein
VTEILDRFGPFPSSRNGLAGANLKFQHTLARAHNVKSANHSDPARSRRHRHEFARGFDDGLINPGWPSELGVRKRDSPHTAVEDMPVAADSTQQPGVKAIGVGPMFCDARNERSTRFSVRLQ